MCWSFRFGEFRWNELNLFCVPLASLVHLEHVGEGRKGVKYEPEGKQDTNLLALATAGRSTSNLGLTPRGRLAVCKCCSQRSDSRASLGLEIFVSFPLRTRLISHSFLVPPRPVSSPPLPLPFAQILSFDPPEPFDWGMGVVQSGLDRLEVYRARRSLSGGIRDRVKGGRGGRFNVP